MLFNPALAQQSIPQKTRKEITTRQNFKQLVLGARDEVVNPVGTFQFLAQTLPTYTDYVIHFRQDLAHRIPVSIFEDEVKRFFVRF